MHLKIMLVQLKAPYFIDTKQSQFTLLDDLTFFDPPPSSVFYLREIGSDSVHTQDFTTCVSCLTIDFA